MGRLICSEVIQYFPNEFLVRQLVISGKISNICDSVLNSVNVTKKYIYSVNDKNKQKITKTD